MIWIDWMDSVEASQPNCTGKKGESVATYEGAREGE